VDFTCVNCEVDSSQDFFVANICAKVFYLEHVISFFYEFVCPAQLLASSLQLQARAASYSLPAHDVFFFPRFLPNARS
jgi:hypothetical protein